MSKPNTERNKKIVELKDKENKTFRDIARNGLPSHGFLEMSEKNVHKIYHREKAKQKEGQV